MSSLLNRQHSLEARQVSADAVVAADITATSVLRVPSGGLFTNMRAGVTGVVSHGGFAQPSFDPPFVSLPVYVVATPVSTGTAVATPVVASILTTSCVIWNYDGAQNIAYNWIAYSPVG
jgi:hypothetical protein